MHHVVSFSHFTKLLHETLRSVLSERKALVKLHLAKPIYAVLKMPFSLDLHCCLTKCQMDVNCWLYLVFCLYRNVSPESIHPTASLFHWFPPAVVMSFFFFFWVWFYLFWWNSLCLFAKHYAAIHFVLHLLKMNYLSLKKCEARIVFSVICVLFFSFYNWWALVFTEICIPGRFVFAVMSWSENQNTL